MLGPVIYRQYAEPAVAQMLERARRLRDECGCIAIKGSMEDEGSSLEDLLMLAQVADRADMRLVVKVGGVEAVADLEVARQLGASSVMAPMVESPFALRKFRGAAQRVYGEQASAVEWVLTAETITCHDNFAEILKAGEGFLDTVGIGRVDLTSSLGLSRAEVDGPRTLELCRDMACAAREAGLMVCFGGGIGQDSIPFISQMASLADKFETRKVVFGMNADPEHLRRCIVCATEFELFYMTARAGRHERLATQDRSRIAMLQERL